jgi:hypothetical protein
MKFLGQFLKRKAFAQRLLSRVEQDLKSEKPKTQIEWSVGGLWALHLFIPDHEPSTGVGRTITVNSCRVELSDLGGELFSRSFFWTGAELHRLYYLTKGYKEQEAETTGRGEKNVSQANKWEEMEL